MVWYLQLDRPPCRERIDTAGNLTVHMGLIFSLSNADGTVYIEITHVRGHTPRAESAKGALEADQ